MLVMSVTITAVQINGSLRHVNYLKMIREFDVEKLLDNVAVGKQGNKVSFKMISYSHNFSKRSQKSSTLF